MGTEVEKLPYVGLGPCAFCGHPDAGHRVRDSMAERLRAGDSFDELAADYGVTLLQAEALVAMSEADSWKPCSCGDRSRPNINHRVRIPCWTYVGSDRFDVDRDGHVMASVASVVDHDHAD